MSLTVVLTWLEGVALVLVTVTTPPPRPTSVRPAIWAFKPPTTGPGSVMAAPSPVTGTDAPTGYTAVGLVPVSVTMNGRSGVPAGASVVGVQSIIRFDGPTASACANCACPSSRAAVDAVSASTPPSAVARRLIRRFVRVRNIKMGRLLCVPVPLRRPEVASEFVWFGVLLQVLGTTSLRRRHSTPRGDRVEENV